MTNIKPLLKRVCAYILDLFIVLIISSLISSIPVLNKDLDNYQKLYEEYSEKYNVYFKYLTLLQESYEDKEINSEEYAELTESSKYKELVISKYDDSKISNKEYKEIIKELNEKFNEVAERYSYLLNKNGVSNSIITVICTLLYFGILQYLFKGQTIGKRLFKLKVVSNSDKKINIITYLLRALIVNDIFLNTVGIIILLVSSRTTYQYANNIIGTVISIVEAVIIFFVLTREDRRGLHDLLLNTKVIDVEHNENRSKQDIEIEKDNEIKIKVKKQSSSKNKKKIIDADYKEQKNSKK